MRAPSVENVYRLGLKEIQSIRRDRVLLIMIIFSFSLGIYIAATGRSHVLRNASLAIVDEDRSQLSARFPPAFKAPYFSQTESIEFRNIDRAMDRGEFLFALVIPDDFERDTIRGDRPDVQLNIDATAVMQAGIGAGYIQSILQQETRSFLIDLGEPDPEPVRLSARYAFNPNLKEDWFNAIAEIINKVTVLTIILSGAALLRERERGTVEHLLTLPVTPLEILLGKVWANASIVLLAVTFAVFGVIKGFMSIDLVGSVPLFLAFTAIYLIFASALGIFMATITSSMPQFALLVILVMMPMMMLSGIDTPVESQPDGLRHLMLMVPTTHFVKAAQAILNRGAGFGIVWPNFVVIAVVGALLFGGSALRFRKSIIGYGS